MHQDRQDRCARCGDGRVEPPLRLCSDCCRDALGHDLERAYALDEIAYLYQDAEGMVCIHCGDPLPDDFRPGLDPCLWCGYVPD